jgi:hypothetical protein
MCKKDVFLLFLVFVLSVLVRVPNLNRPLSKHHEFNAAFFLIPMEIWNQTSVGDYFFSPVLNYSNCSDKGINNFSAGETQKNGNYYYFSFGPGAYLIPYFFLTLVGVPTLLGLQIFSLIVHFFCALLLVKITRIFVPNSGRRSLLPGVFYLFAPASLWFHGNGYTHHSLVVLFFLGAVFCALKVRLNPRLFFPKFGLFIFLFLAVYTEWIGCILGFILVFLFLFQKMSSKLQIVSIVFSAVLLAISLLVFQYAFVVGLKDITTYLYDRFWSRSLLDKGLWSQLALVKKLAYWYLISFGVLLVLLSLSFYFVRKKRINFKGNLLYVVLVLPVFFHHFIFSEFTIAHDYSVLIDGTFLCILLGIMTMECPLQGRKFKIGLSFFLVVSMGHYYYINRPGDVGQNGDRYDDYQQIGTFIRKHASKDEVIFIEDLPDLPNPQVVFYAKRNFYSIDDKSEIAKKMKMRSEKKVFYMKLERFKRKEIKHIHLQ